MASPRPRPTLYPVQLVVSLTDELGERVSADAEARADKSKSAAARRLLTLGAMLADVLDHSTRGVSATLDGLLDDAKAVK